MAMQIRQYNAERIAQYGRSIATLNATGHRHRASIRPVSPRRMPWSSILELKSSCAIVTAQNGPSIQLIEATNCVERWNAMIKAEEHS